MKKILLSLLFLAAGLTAQASHGSLMSSDGGAAEDYKLRITGITVTDENKDDILGDGTVSFDSTDKTLTFNNATIEYQGNIVSCWEENLTIQFFGSNTLTAKSRYGGYTTVIGAYNSEYDDVTLKLTGPGSLTAYGDISGTSGHTHITGNLKMTLMNGVISTSVKDAHLVFSGAGTKVKAYHDTDYCIISNFYSMTLNDELQITQPAGAYYDATTYRLRDTNGNEVQKQWVTIEAVKTGIGVWLNNEALTSSYMSGSGWHYSDEDNTLYLTGDIMTTTAGSAILVNGNVNPTLNICVQGECTLTGSFDTGLMFAGSGSHTIYGDGTLNIKSRVVDPLGAIACESPDLCFKDLTVNIEQSGGLGINCHPVNSFTLDNCTMSIKTNDGTAMFRFATCTPVLINCQPTEPVNSFIIKNGWYWRDYDGMGGYTSYQVTDGKIERKVDYDLWYQGEQVTSFYYSNWLDAENNIFTVYYSASSEEPLIVNGIEGLTVFANEGTATSWYWTSEKDVLLTHADMTLTQYPQDTKLPIKSFNGNVMCVDNNATLTIENAYMNLYSLNKWAITGNNQNEKLVLRNVNLIAYGEEGAIGGFSDIDMEGCHILCPEGGYVKDGTVVDRTGHVAKSVIIISRTDNWYSYNLSVSSKFVNHQNKDDVMGDGTVRFDAATLTLYVKGGQRAIHNSGVPGLTVNFTDDTEVSWMGLYAPTTLKGIGKLSLKGNLSILDHAKLTLDNVNIESASNSRCNITGTASEHTRLFIKNSNVKLTPGVVYNGGGITLEDCELVEPVGGSIGWQGTSYIAILGTNGYAAESVIIKATKPQIPTAITSPEVTYDAGLQQPIYNLSGQRVGDGYRGIVIINGKKVLR